MKSFLTKDYSRFLLFFIFICAPLITACSKSDDQREFEDKAFQQPEGITQTDANGKIEHEDPSDWNVSPRYSGLIEVQTPAYPNPVAYNSSNLRIELYLRGVENINSIEVFTFRYPDESSVYGPLYIDNNLSSSSSFVTINLSGKVVAHSSGGSQAEGIYRVLIYDQKQENLITYGDVQVGLD